MTEEVRWVLFLALFLIVIIISASLAMEWVMRRYRRIDDEIHEKVTIVFMSSEAPLVLVHAEVVDVGMITGILYEDGEEHGWYSFPLHTIRSIHWEKIDDEQ